MSTKCIGLTIVIFAIAGPAVLMAAPAAAQNEATDQSNNLQEVIVTAQRREESLQRAAIAIDVVSADQLVQANLSSQNQLGQLVPALSIQNSGGANTTLFLRGVGNFTVNGYSDPAIAFNYDGIYVGRPTSTSGYFFDLERIEVLKGPQGTLYGRNATGGAINILPARPRLGEFSGMSVGTFGNYDAAGLQAALNVPLGERTAVRVAGNYSEHSGYLSDKTSDENAHAFRLQLLHEVTPDLTVRLAADYSHQGGRGAGATHVDTAIPNGTGYDIVPTGLDSSVGFLDPRTQAFHQSLYSFVSGQFLPPIEDKSHLDNAFYGVNAEIAWEASPGTFVLIPGYRKSSIDNIYAISGYNNWIQEKDDQTSIEARFTSKRFGNFDALAGLYYFDEKIDGNYTFDPQYFLGFQDFKTSTESYAAFTRLTAHVSERLRLTGGVRFTQDEKKFNGASDLVLEVCAAAPFPMPACPTAPALLMVDSPDQIGFAVPNPGDPPIPLGTSGAVAVRSFRGVQDSSSFDRVTYRAGAEFDLTPHSLLYTSYETGYRSGGFSLAAGHETYAPEYIRAYTVGSKNRFLDDRAQVNLEAFYWKYTDQQVSHFGLDVNGMQAFFTDNVGKSTNKGVELDVEYLATANTLLSADIQYLAATFDSFVYAVPRGATPPYTGCPFAVNPANPAEYNVDCSGQQAFNSPKWTVNLGGQQTIPLGAHKLVLGASTQYKSSLWSGFGYWPFVHAPSNWRTNLRVMFSDAAERWSLTGFVDNLENDRTVVTGNVDDFNGGYAITTAPRTYGVRLTARF